jgi:hypothetical protein
MAFGTRVSQTGERWTAQVWGYAFGTGLATGGAQELAVALTRQVRIDITRLRSQRCGKSRIHAWGIFRQVDRESSIRRNASARRVFANMSRAVREVSLFGSIYCRLESAFTVLEVCWCTRHDDKSGCANEGVVRSEPPGLR